MLRFARSVRTFLPTISRASQPPLRADTTTAKTINKMSSKSGQALEKLREIGYAFNSEGELRKIDAKTGEPGSQPFQFEVYNCPMKNQEHYEKLAEQIPDIVYDLLEQVGLSRIYLPRHVPREHATFIFSYPAVLKKPEKLIIFIHGSGFVRAGQWARSLIINNSLNHGTQIPYIKRAQELGYNILVTNTNDSHRMVDGGMQRIPEMYSPSKHARYVWKNCVMPSEPESVAVVAHSFGGALALDLAQRYPEFFKEKVFAIALTDSVHSVASGEMQAIIKDRTRNWISSTEPLGTPVFTDRPDIQRISAGNTKHEWTSYSAIDSVFNFLEKKYADFTGNESGKKKEKLDS